MEAPQRFGPNIRRLIAERAAQLQVERAKQRHGVADVGTLAVGIVDGTLQETLREASTWVQTALALLRNAPGSEQWPTDEAMAGELVRQIEERQKGKR